MPVELEMIIYAVIGGLGVFGTLLFAIIMQVIHTHNAKGADSE